MMVDSGSDYNDLLVNNTNTTDELIIENDGVAVGDLFATLLQIFLTIKLGWLSGTFKVIDRQQAKGLDIFVGKYALPVLIFSSLVRLDFGQIEWSFLIGIAGTKLFVFVTVFLIEYFLHTPRNLSRPSIFAILCTQTNDFGMGLPILESVYGTDHKYIGLLYLVGPISLLILNPIGFTFLETEKSVAEGHKTNGFKNKIKILFKILRGLLMNPIVNMTLLGIIGNFAFNKQLPFTLDKFLSAIGRTFTSLAPFALGLNMVGKMNNLRGGSMKTIIGLLVMKGLVTPLLCHIIIEQIGILLNGQSDPGLSNYGMLYGFIPPALGVDSYASAYNVNPELVSGSIVIITVLSAPMMYLSANILKVLNVDGEALNKDLMKFLTDVSSIAVVGVIFILMIFIVSKRYKKMPHMLTVSLAIFSLESGIGGILRGSFIDPNSDASPATYITVFLSHHGIYSGKFCATILSVVLYLIIIGKDQFVTKYKILIVLFSPVLAAIVTTTLILIFKAGCDLNFGNGQDVFDLVIDVICFSTMIIFLAKSSRLDEKHRKVSCDPNTPYQVSKCTIKRSTYTPQIFRHFLLLILYSGSLFSNMTLNIFRIATFSHSGSAPGLYQVLVFIDSFLWTGQGSILLSVFAFDCTYVLNPMDQFFRWISRKLRGREDTTENKSIISASA